MVMVFYVIVTSTHHHVLFVYFTVSAIENVKKSSLPNAVPSKFPYILERTRLEQHDESTPKEHPKKLFIIIMSGGTSCAYRGCSLRTGQGVSLFCFPKDHEQAKKWIEACYRTDLIPKIEILHKNYKLCEQHFEDKHISKTGTSRRRLLPNAIPTLFAHNLKREVQEVPITSEVDKSKDDSYKIIIISDYRNKFRCESPVFVRFTKSFEDTSTGSASSTSVYSHAS